MILFVKSRLRQLPSALRGGTGVLSGALLAAGLLASSVLAQETTGVAPNTGGAVLKGKAPVAKDLLNVRLPKPKMFKLSNGVSVFVLEDHRLPSVRMQLSMHAGLLYEPKPAVAETTAAMLTEGTQTRDYLKLAEYTADMGASVSSSAGADMATIGVAGLSESTDALIALMADVLLHPAFPADRLERIKFQQKSAISQRRTNPAGLAAELASKVYYGGTPYARASPTAAAITSLSPADLTRFHDAFYRPNGAILGVSGDVEMKSLKAKLEAALGGWKPTAVTLALPKAVFTPKEKTQIYLIDRPGSAQTVLQFGNLSVRQNDPDYVALTVANRILGGGSSGRLFQNIREQKGYTYGAYSTLSAGQWPGLWGASASVRTPVTEPATREFFREFDRLQDEPVAPSDLERAKRSIIGAFAGTLESSDAILSRTIDLVQNGLPLDYWDTYPARIQAVTPAEVQRIARKYLGKNRIQLIAVGERSQIEEGLKKFGPVEIVDAAALAAGQP
jgi:zinc protease